MPNQEKDTNITLTREQQDPALADPNSFTIFRENKEPQLDGQTDAAQLVESQRIHPNQPFSERNTVPAVDW